MPKTTACDKLVARRQRKCTCTFVVPRQRAKGERQPDVARSATGTVSEPREAGLCKGATNAGNAASPVLLWGRL